MNFNRRISGWIYFLVLVFFVLTMGGSLLSILNAEEYAEDNIETSRSGTGSSDDPYQIATPEQLKELSDQVAAGKTFAGEYFIVTANLDMKSYSNWVPIGSSSQLLVIRYYQGSAAHPITGTIKAKVFSGHFDGQGYTINNLTSTATGTSAATDYRGLFGITNNATIKNLTINNANVKGSSALGGLVGLASGNTVIENCHVKNSSLNSNTGGGGLATGGLIGEINYEQDNVVKVLNCSGEGNEVASNLVQGSVGGLIGNIRSSAISEASPIANMNASILIKGCNVTGGSVNAYHYYVGGVIGQIVTWSTGGNKIEIADCTSDIPVQTLRSNGYYVGGVIGFVYIFKASTNNTVSITNCHAYGSVSTTIAGAYYVGGLAGYLTLWDASDSAGNSFVIDGCSAHGNVSGISYYNGGLVGYMYNGIVIKNSWATGNVTGSLYGNGGLVGYSRSGETLRLKCEIMNSYATGHVKGGTDYNGGLVGWNRNTDIQNSYSTGSVNGYAATTGGLIGWQYVDSYYSSLIKNCYATGTVLSGDGGFAGSFAVSGSANTTFTNCFYDTTTTKKTDIQAVASAKRDGIKALTTGSGMINIETYGDVWKARDNLNGDAAGAGNEERPWYIDDKVTYPYLWYQYEGHDKKEVNYNLSLATYNYTNNNTINKNITRRADFIVEGAGTNQAVYYNVQTVGAQAVYFPYLAQDYNFSGQSEITVPSDGSHTVANSSTVYSMGGISATDIISFDILPYAEKTSNRKVFQEGDQSTYTMRGDLVEYKVTITNPNTRYEWVDVQMSDSLPEGVTLVEGLYNGQNYNVTVKVNNGQAAAIPKGAENAANGSPYYTYEKAMSDIESDIPLRVYIGDFPVATELTGGGVEKYMIEITFTALIDRRAVSQFPLDDQQNIIVNGDNIRNQGTVKGTIRGADTAFTYKTDFDDKNTDPVYDAYKVSYIGNGGITDAGDLKYDFYYPYDETFLVNSNQGTPFQFNCTDYLFLGEWYSRAEKAEGKTEVYVIDREYGLVSDQNPIESDYRDDADNLDDVYNDYYALTDFKLYAPWLKQAGSITIEKKNEEGTELPGARFLLEKWDAVENDWITLLEGETGSNGELILGKDGIESTLSFGTYRLTEVKSPYGYSLLKEPLTIELPYEVAAAANLETPEYEYVNDDDQTIFSYFNLRYTITNVGTYRLPESGTIEVPWYFYAGTLMLSAAVIFLIVRYDYRRKKLST